jgi:polyferredoxin
MPPAAVARNTDKPTRPAKDGRKVHLRHGVQIVLLAVTVAVGIQFALFVHQAAHSNPVTIQRPPGVEGFLPIGGLMGWKLFFTTGTWDPVHPAAMVILGFAALISWAWRKSFCAWICPVGTLSEGLWRLGRRWFGRNFQPPKWIDIVMRSVKYALLGFFVWVIFRMDARAILGFFRSPYYQLSDVKMLHFFTHISLFAGGVLFFLACGSLFIRNFWCRYLCPYGALMGLLAMAGPTRIRRNPQTCIDCGRCTRDCPSHLPVGRKAAILSPECSGCLDCIQTCPVQGTLTLETTGLRHRGWTPAALALAILLVFAASIYTARITGHWQSQLSTGQFQHLLQRIDSPPMVHPSVGGTRSTPDGRPPGP